MFASKIRRILIGDPLHNSQQAHELIPKWKALALLAADALSSIAYATEEIIIPLALSGLAFATTWSLPISLAILGLMFIITLSYRQTIQAYPNGGGAYIVAKDNLGTGAGLVAGAALLIDYTLTVAVSVSAGVENLVSAFPGMAGVQVFTCVWIILFLMVLSLRGVKDSATIFAIPTYLFIFSIFALIITGLVRGPQDVNIHPHTVLMNNLPDIGWILALKAFSSGCTALTGIEAVSNGIPLFRHPQSKNANMTLLMMVVILGSMFAGITYLVNSYDIVKIEGVTLLASLTQAVFGQSFAFYFVQISIFLILFMAASTAYADFPRLSSLLAIDRYAPRQLISQGDRLVFSNGIIALSMGAIALVIIFRGHTHSLIPLYAVGVFLSFTLSQAGMVVHHWRLREKGWKGSMVMNAIGTLVTFCVLIVIGSFKFTHGAWMVIITIPIIVYAFHRIHVHYVMFARELSQSHYDIDAEGHTKDHVVVIPVSGLHLGVMNAIRYGKSISKDVRVIYVKTDEVSAQRMHEAWAAKFPDMQLHVLDSPYRSISTPILDFIDHVRNENPMDFITVIFPEFVTFKWYHQLLHNQTAWLIKLSLIYKKNVIVTSVKYHLSTT
ncbi:MAG: APC family permease [Pseudobdellovibrio sp.]|nr:APC family permease [Pseudobdellovibrio sp.]